MFLDDASWCTNPDDLKREATTFFKSLFAADSSSNVSHLQVLTVPQLSQDGVNSLTGPVTMDEVRRAVFSMKSYKAPGPDGFQPLFYKHFWELVYSDLWSFVQQTLLQGPSDTSISKILIVLIPKIDQPMRFKELRPISLCNLRYNIITKVLVAAYKTLP